MILPQNRYLDAATAILGNKDSAMVLIRRLKSRNLENFLFIAEDATPMRAAVLLLQNEGATTTFLSTPPQNLEDVKHISNLIVAGVESIQKGTTQLLQTLMQENDELHRQAFEHAGFEDLAILTYMESSKIPNIPTPERLQISMISMDIASDEQLQHVLQDTYIDSLDCPKIHGLRRIQDIIAGHRGQGDYDPQLWSIAELDGKPAGVLLLNPVQEAMYMELAYLGCTPQYRGLGLGDALMRQAAEQTSSYGLTSIKLAVDIENLPAIKLYTRWGFRQSRKRLTMIRHCC